MSKVNPLAGIKSISFAIYKDQFEDAPLWMETQNATVDAEGNYSVQLGATEPRRFAARPV